MKDVELNKVADFESALLSLWLRIQGTHGQLDETGEYSDDVLASFKEALKNSNQHKLGNMANTKEIENKFPVFQIRKKLRALWKWSLQAKCVKPKTEWRWAGLMRIVCSQS